MRYIQWYIFIDNHINHDQWYYVLWIIHQCVLEKISFNTIYRNKLARFQWNCNPLLRLYRAFFTFGERNDARKTNVQLLVVSCQSNYNYILGRLTIATLGLVSLTVHVKMKYHITNEEVVTICADLKGAKSCHRTLLRNLDAIIV